MCRAQCTELVPVESPEEAENCCIEGSVPDVIIHHIDSCQHAKSGLQQGLLLWTHSFIHCQPFFLVTQKANESFIHPRIHPEKLTSCALQPRSGALPGGQSSALFHYNASHSPSLALVPLHACSVGRPATQHPSRQSAIHPSIHTFEPLTSCTPWPRTRPLSGGQCWALFLLP